MYLINLHQASESVIATARGAGNSGGVNVIWRKLAVPNAAIAAAPEESAAVPHILRALAAPTSTWRGAATMSRPTPMR